MSVTKPIMLDETGLSIVEKLEAISTNLRQPLASQVQMTDTTLGDNVEEAVSALNSSLTNNASLETTSKSVVGAINEVNSNLTNKLPKLIGTYRLKNEETITINLSKSPTFYILIENHINNGVGAIYLIATGYDLAASFRFIGGGQRLTLESSTTTSITLSSSNINSFCIYEISSWA